MLAGVVNQQLGEEDKEPLVESLVNVRLLVQVATADWMLQVQPFYDAVSVNVGGRTTHD